MIDNDISIEQEDSVMPKNPSPRRPSTSERKRRASSSSSSSASSSVSSRKRRSRQEDVDSENNNSSSNNKMIAVANDVVVGGGETDEKASSKNVDKIEYENDWTQRRELSHYMPASGSTRGDTYAQCRSVDTHRAHQSNANMHV